MREEIAHDVDISRPVLARCDSRIGGVDTRVVRIEQHDGGTGSSVGGPRFHELRCREPRRRRCRRDRSRNLAKFDLTGAVVGVWKGDEKIVEDAAGESPVGVPATPDMQWVQGFPRGDKITPRMLANSTSGISDYVTNPDS